MKINKKTRRKELLLILIALLAFVSGSVFVFAFGSENPPWHGHDIEEMNWTELIPAINTDQLCMQGTCRAAWPVFTDTRCDSAASDCHKLCIGSVCRDIWPTSVAAPPVCSGNEILVRSGGGWACEHVNVAGPTRYRCPNEADSCATQNPKCNGQIQAGSVCYGHYRAFYDFCIGCGCYINMPYSCEPLYD
ncbi:MAG: hypothetical protein JXC85_01295 [Candidatus Aenigmarchaeota archaeon]|nr:hypothetical protein [Candidatus Aenigmarchaeota archaeon]